MARWLERLYRGLGYKKPKSYSRERIITQKPPNFIERRVMWDSSSRDWITVEPKDLFCPNCREYLEDLRECKLCGWFKESKEEKERRSRYVPRHIVGEVWRRFEGKCAECGSENDLHIDHIIPFSKGGSNHIDNLQLLCKNCNLKKSSNI